MPRCKVNFGCSNLSLVIPRSIHRATRIKAIQSGAPSFASYVALILSQAPEQLSVQQMIQTHTIELALKINGEKRHDPDAR